MAKGILVSYSGYPYTPSSFMPDNGLANLAGSLKGEGHEALILDFGAVDTIRTHFPDDIGKRIRPIYRKISEGGKLSLKDKAMLLYLNNRLERHQQRELQNAAEYVEEMAHGFGADFIGFKLWMGDGFSGSVYIADHVKSKNPDIKTFGGGPQADLFKELIMRKYGVFDVIAFSEGEDIICSLAEYADGHRHGLDEVPNVIYRDGVNGVKTNERILIEDLDSLPLPLYDEETYPSLEGDGKIKIITLDESRGCPFGCYFCAQPPKSGSRTRKKSPERIVREINRMIEEYGINAFRYAGSSTPGKLMLEVAKDIKGNDTRVKYTSFAEANLLNDTQATKILRNSGLVSLFFGIESGSQKMLDSVHKCLDLDVLEKALNASKEAGIYTVGSIMYPLPGETPETREETLSLLERTRPDSVPVQFSGLYPETPWFNDPARYGFQVDMESYPSSIMDYKIKLLFPPTMWKDPGYRIDGKRFKEFSRETMDMVKEIERMGILTGISDDQFLMAELADMSPEEFRNLNREYFFTGDHNRIGEMVKKINENIRGFENE